MTTRVRIPQYDQRTSVQMVGAPQARAVPGISAFDAAGGQIERASRDIASAAAHIADQDAAVWSARASAGMREWGDRQMVERQERAAAGAPDFTPTLLRDFDTEAERVLGEAPSPRSRAFLAERLASYRASLSGDALRFEAGARMDNRVRLAGETLEINRNSLLNNPDRFATVYGETVGLIDGLAVTPQARTRLHEQARNGLAQSAIQGIINRDPARAVEELSGTTWDRFVDPDRKASLLNTARDRLDTGARQQRVVDQGRVLADASDDLAALRASGRGAGRDGVLRATPERIRQAFPGRQGDQLIAQIRIAEQVWPLRRRLATATPEEAAQIVEQVRAQVGSEEPAPGGFEAALVQRESGGDPRRVNDLGYAGLYQFGTARLADLGLYRPSAGENLRSNEWRGTFAIPGHEGVRTLQDFLASPEAQRAAFRRHVSNIDESIDRRGLLDRQGQNVGGVTVTRNALRAMAHLGGVQGMTDFVQSGGASNPADANQTRLSDYGVAFGGIADGGLAPGVDARAELAREVERIYDERRQAVARDPAGYVMENFPRVRAQFEDAQRLAQAGNPDAAAARSTAMATMIEAQRSIGVPEHRVAPLPPAFVANVAGAFAAAQTARDRLIILERATDIPDEAIRSRVVDQLAGQGPEGNRIPREIDRIIEIARTPSMRNAAENLLGALSVPQRDIAAMPPTARASLESKIGSTFDSSGQGAGYYLGLSDATPGVGRILQEQEVITGRQGHAAQEAERYRDALRHVARARDGADPSAEVERAYGEMFGDRATLRIGGLAAIWYPRGGVDPAELRRGMEVLRAREADRFRTEYAPGPDADRVTQLRHERVAGTFASGATWINEGNLFALVDPTEGRIFARHGLDAILQAARAAQAAEARQ